MVFYTMCIIYIYTNKACKSGWGSWLLFQRSPKRGVWLNLGTTSQKVYKKTGQRQEMCIDKASKQSPHKTIHLHLPSALDRFEWSMCSNLDELQQLNTTQQHEMLGCPRWFPIFKPQSVTPNQCIKFQSTFASNKIAKKSNDICNSVTT